MERAATTKLDDVRTTLHRLLLDFGPFLGAELRRADKVEQRRALYLGRRSKHSHRLAMTSVGAATRYFALGNTEMLSQFAL